MSPSRKWCCPRRRPGRGNDRPIATSGVTGRESQLNGRGRATTKVAGSCMNPGLVVAGPLRYARACVRGIRMSWRFSGVRRACWGDLALTRVHIGCSIPSAPIETCMARQKRLETARQACREGRERADGAGSVLGPGFVVRRGVNRRSATGVSRPAMVRRLPTTTNDTDVGTVHGPGFARPPHPALLSWLESCTAHFAVSSQVHLANQELRTRDWCETYDPVLSPVLSSGIRHTSREPDLATPSL